MAAVYTYFASAALGVSAMQVASATVLCAGMYVCVYACVAAYALVAWPGEQIVSPIAFIGLLLARLPAIVLHVATLEGYTEYAWLPRLQLLLTSPLHAPVFAVQLVAACAAVSAVLHAHEYTRGVPDGIIWISVACTAASCTLGRYLRGSSAPWSPAHTWTWTGERETLDDAAGRLSARARVYTQIRMVLSSAVRAGIRGPLWWSPLLVCVCVCVCVCTASALTAVTTAACGFAKVCSPDAASHVIDSITIDADEIAWVLSTWWRMLPVSVCVCVITAVCMEWEAAVVDVVVTRRTPLADIIAGIPASPMPPLAGMPVGASMAIGDDSRVVSLPDPRTGQLRSVLPVDALDLRLTALRLCPHASIAAFMLGYTDEGMLAQPTAAAATRTMGFTMNVLPRSARTPARGAAAAGVIANGPAVSAGVPYRPPAWAFGAARSTASSIAEAPPGFVALVAPEPVPRSVAGLSGGMQAHLSAWQRRMLNGEYALFVGDASACGEPTFSGDALADVQLLLAAALDSVNFCISSAQSASPQLIGMDAAARAGDAPLDGSARLYAAPPTLRALRDACLIATAPAVANQRTSAVSSLVPRPLRPRGSADAVFTIDEAHSLVGAGQVAVQAAVMSAATCQLYPVERAALFADGLGKRWHPFFWSTTALIDALTLVLNSAAQWECEPAVAEAVTANAERLKQAQAAVEKDAANAGVTAGLGTVVRTDPVSEYVLPAAVEALVDDVERRRAAEFGLAAIVLFGVACVRWSTVTASAALVFAALSLRSLFPPRLVPLPRNAPLDTAAAVRGVMGIGVSVLVAAVAAFIAAESYHGLPVVLLDVSLPASVANGWNTGAAVLAAMVSVGLHQLQLNRLLRTVPADLLSRSTLSSVWYRQEPARVAAVLAVCTLLDIITEMPLFRGLAAVALALMTGDTLFRAVQRCCGLVYEGSSANMKWFWDAVVTDTAETLPTFWSALWALIEIVFLIRWIRRGWAVLQGWILMKYLLEYSATTESLLAAIARQVRPVDPVADLKRWVKLRMAYRKGYALPSAGDVVATTVDSSGIAPCAGIRELIGSEPSPMVREPVLIRHIAGYVLHAVTGQPADDAAEQRSLRSGTPLSRSRRSSRSGLFTPSSARRRSGSVGSMSGGWTPADVPRVLDDEAAASAREQPNLFEYAGLAVVLLAWSTLCVGGLTAAVVLGLQWLTQSIGSPLSWWNVAVGAAVATPSALFCIRAAGRGFPAYAADVVTTAPVAQRMVAQQLGAVGLALAMGCASALAVALLLAYLGLSHGWTAAVSPQSVLAVCLQGLIGMRVLAASLRSFTTGSTEDALEPVSEPWTAAPSTNLLVTVPLALVHSMLTGAVTLVSRLLQDSSALLRLLVDPPLFTIATVADAVGVLAAAQTVYLLCSGPDISMARFETAPRKARTRAAAAAPVEEEPHVYDATPLAPEGAGRGGAAVLQSMTRSPEQLTAAIMGDYRAVVACVDLLVEALVDGTRMDRSGVVAQSLPTAIASLSACLAALTSYVLSPRYVAAPAIQTFWHEWAWYPPALPAESWSMASVVRRLALSAAVCQVSLGTDAQLHAMKGDPAWRPAVAAVFVTLVRALRKLKLHLGAPPGAPSGVPAATTPFGTPGRASTRGRPPATPARGAAASVSGIDAFDDIVQRLPSRLLTEVALAATADWSEALN